MNDNYYFHNIRIIIFKEMEQNQSVELKESTKVNILKSALIGALTSQANGTQLEERLLDILRVEHIDFKITEFVAFHPFYSLKLADKDCCRLGRLIINPTNLITSVDIKNDATPLEKEILFFCLYDEVPSVQISNYHLHPENHFTTEVDIKLINDVLHKSNGDWTTYYLIGEITQLSKNKVTMVSHIYSLENSSLVHESSYRIVFKASKGIKF